MILNRFKTWLIVLNLILTAVFNFHQEKTFIEYFTAASFGENF